MVWIYSIIKDSVELIGKNDRFKENIFGGKFNKNCLGSFQVLWNKNCTTENEEIKMEKLILNKNQKKQTKLDLKSGRASAHKLYHTSYIIQVILSKLYYTNFIEQVI